MKTTIVSILTILSIRAVSAQQILIYQESFEDTLSFTGSFSSKFRASGNDHFSWTTGDDISNTTAPYSGYDGDWFWASEDVDHLGVKAQYIQTEPIPSAGYPDLEVRIMVAVGNEAAANGTSGFDRGDSLVVYYSLDGGDSFSRGLKFSYENNGDAFNEPLRLDSDFDGYGDSTYLRTEFQEFSFPVGVAETVIIKVVFTNDADNEEIAIDNIQLWGGDVFTSYPENRDEWIWIGPNPFDNMLKLELLRPGPVRITDAYGREWYNKMCSATEIVDTGYFPSGVYYVRVMDEARTIKCVKR